MEVRETYGYIVPNLIKTGDLLGNFIRHKNK